jgi:dCMP deaminase
MEIMKTNWDLRFMQLSDHIAQWSKDRSSKVGAVIVLDKNPVSMGYNGFPRGCEDDLEERHERPLKYSWVLHAEENAIVNAARNGQRTLGSDMYVNWFPCSRCAGEIVNAGIKRIFCDKEPDWTVEDTWTADHKIAKQKLHEGGVEIIIMNYEAHRNANDRQ